jgi:hypothetical protein
MYVTLLMENILAILLNCRQVGNRLAERYGLIAAPYLSGNTLSTISYRNVSNAVLNRGTAAG